MELIAFFSFLDLAKGRDNRTKTFIISVGGLGGKFEPSKFVFFE